MRVIHIAASSLQAAGHNKRFSMIMKGIQIIAVMLMAATSVNGILPPVLADAASNAQDVLKNGIVPVVSLITNIVGIIFVVVGFVRYVMAHAQDDGPSQQKAALFIGTGIALFLVGSIIKNMNVDLWISNDNLHPSKK